MTKLEKLIKELCPDGVEFKSIGSFIKRSREKGAKEPNIKQVYVVSNSKGMVKAEEYRDNTVHSDDTSNYIIVRPGMCAYNPSRLNIGSIAILKGENPGLVSPMYVVFSIDHDMILEEYFEYILDSSYVKNKIDAYKEEGARFRFDFERWGWINIPLPPLNIQKEIVRILNNFSSLIKELDKELDARQQQYAFYRNKLLNLENEDMKALSEITYNISSGKNKERLTDGNYPVYGSTGVISSTNSAVYDKEQILIARVGANAGFVHIARGKYDVSDNTLIVELKEDINMKYVYYQLFNMNLHQFAKGGGQPLITAGQMKQIEIPIPDKKKQDEIVKVLEKFDTITTDISIGLPGEIEKRRKQYEYYRDKLLSFKEAGVNE